MKHVASAVLVLPLLVVSCMPPCCNVPWSYGGARSPDRWGALSPCYAGCKDGGEQSPTDLSHAVFADLPKLEPRYAGSATVGVVNDGHTIKAYVPAGSTLTIGENEFTLEEFHFHTKSEHRLEGEQTPIEIHLVHKGAGGRTAAVGVFIIEGAANPALAKIWTRLEEYGKDRIPVAGINIMALLPGSYASFRYAGSLTTPACGQGLQWNVLAKPITASAEQIKKLEELFKPYGNSRPPQLLNGRTVLRDFH